MSNRNYTNKSLHNIKVIRYGVTDSTNTRAREYAEGGFELPAVFIAEGQTAGRGRRGRSFDSVCGAGLYVSFLYRPDAKANDTAIITVGAAVKAARAIEAVCGISVGIKWVNDLIAGGKKLGGILTEGKINSLTGEFDYAICGIGINLKRRVFSPELSEIATTVEDEGGALPDTEELAVRLTEEFFREESAAEIIEQYRRRCVVIGKDVEVRRISGELFRARAVGVTDRAALTVEREDGVREELISAEVSVRL